MNKIVLLCLGISVAVIIFFILYMIPYFSKKKIRHGKFDLQQFFNLFIAPIFFIPFLYFIRLIILENPFQRTIFTPKYLNELLFLLFLYFMIMGNSIHSVSVVLSKHMKGLKHHKVWEINEFFHNAFSHFMLTAGAILIVFSFAILEINHPSAGMLTKFDVVILIATGILSGIILGIESIEGSIPKLILPILYGLSLLVPFIFTYYHLDFHHFPFTTFAQTMFTSGAITIFLYRQINHGYPEMVQPIFFDE